MTLEAVFVVVGVIAAVISVAALAARLPAAKRLAGATGAAIIGRVGP